MAQEKSREEQLLTQLLGAPGVCRPRKRGNNLSVMWVLMVLSMAPGPVKGVEVLS